MQPNQTRLGVILFAIYSLFYAAFVLLNAYAPESMGSSVGGLNVALIYGFALIVFALVLACLYGFLTRPRPQSEEPK